MKRLLKSLSGCVSLAEHRLGTEQWAAVLVKPRWRSSSRCSKRPQARFTQPPEQAARLTEGQACRAATPLACPGTPRWAWRCPGCCARRGSCCHETLNLALEPEPEQAAHLTKLSLQGGNAAGVPRDTALGAALPGLLRVPGQLRP